MRVRSKSTNLCPSVEKWTLSGGAYLDSDGYIVLPNSNSSAYTYIDWPADQGYKSLYIGADFNKMGSTETTDCHWSVSYYKNGSSLSGNGRAMEITSIDSDWRDMGGFGGNNQYGTAIEQSDKIRINLIRSASYAKLPYKFKNVSARYINNYKYFPMEFKGKIRSHNKKSQIISYNSKSGSLNITKSDDNRSLLVQQASNADSYFKVNNTEYTSYIGKVIIEAKHDDLWVGNGYNFQLWHPSYNASRYGDFKIGIQPGSYYHVFDKTNSDTLFLDDTIRASVGTIFEFKWYKYEDFINKISYKDRLTNYFNVNDWYNWLRTFTTSYVKKAIVDGIDCIYYRPSDTYNKDWLNGQFEANTRYTLTYKAKGIVGTSSSTGFRFYYTDGTASGSNVPNESKWVNMSITSTAGKTVKSIHMGYNYGQGCYIDENSVQLFKTPLV